MVTYKSKGFNSKLVRLEAQTASKIYFFTLTSFNSKLVRLEVNMCCALDVLYDSFNSKLVRLEV